MPKIGSIVTRSAALALLAALANPSIAGAQNLVLNPGFEQEGGSSVTANWWGMAAPGGLAERRTNDAHTGQAAVLLEGDPLTGGMYCVSYQHDVPVLAGEEYEMRFYAKAFAVNGNVGFRPEFREADGTLIGAISTFNVNIESSLTSEYQEFSAVFTAPLNAGKVTVTNFVSWSGQPGDGFTSVYVDDVSFERFVPVCPCEFDATAGVTMTDLLTFIRLWFDLDPAADIDGTPGTDVGDMLEFLSCWFNGVMSAGDCF